MHKSIPHSQHDGVTHAIHDHLCVCCKAELHFIGCLSCLVATLACLIHIRNELLLRFQGLISRIAEGFKALSPNICTCTFLAVSKLFVQICILMYLLSFSLCYLLHHLNYSNSYWVLRNIYARFFCHVWPVTLKTLHASWYCVVLQYGTDV